MEYIKGECLDTKEKFVKHLGRELPYSFMDEPCRSIHDDDYYKWSEECIIRGQYFQAIEKPEPKFIVKYVIMGCYHDSDPDEFYFLRTHEAALEMIQEISEISLGFDYLKIEKRFYKTV